MSNKIHPGNTCWNCGFNKHGGPKTFIGKCWGYPEKYEDGMDLIGETADLGCPRWKPKISLAKREQHDVSCPAYDNGISYICKCKKPDIEG